MKIIWITSLFPSGSDTTKGIYLYNTVKALSKYYDITIICIFPAVPPLLKMIEKPFEAKKRYDYWKRNYPRKPVKPKDLISTPVYYIRYWRLPRKFSAYLEGYYAYFKTRSIIKKLVTKDSILHSSWIFPSGQLAKIISGKYKVPYTVSLLGTDVHNLKYGSKYWSFAKRVIESAKIISSVSPQLIEKCRREKIHIDDNKIAYIDNIYDENIFCIKDRNEIRIKNNIRPDIKIILYAGGLVDVKNVDLLVRAVSELSKVNSDISLYIAGSGPNEGHLRELAKKLMVSEKIVFLGNLLQEDLINFMNIADVFCLPSLNEGMPNVVIESLLCGTAVVGSNVGGIPNIISNDENGYLFESNNVLDLTNRLSASLKKNWDREKIRKSVRRFYSTETLKQYHNLYKRLASGI